MKIPLNDNTKYVSMINYIYICIGYAQMTLNTYVIIRNINVYT